MNLHMRLNIFIFSFFFSVFTYAVPSGSAYDTQEPQFFMNDELQDQLSMTSFLLCFMSQLAPDEMAGPDPVTYLALVDEPSCSSGSQVQSGQQAESKAAAASAKASAAGVNYTKVTTTVSQDSSTSPMVVKAWVPIEVGGGVTAKVYTSGSVTAPVSDSAPYGEFDFNYTGYSTDLGGIDIFYGQMSASGSQVLWFEKNFNQETGQYVDYKSVQNFASSAGNGAIRYSNDDDMNIAAYAYNTDNFCRQVKSINGSDVSADEACFHTDEAQGKKEVFSYSLYNSTTGEQYDLENGGFSIRFNDSGTIKYAYADSNGVHMDETTSKGLSDGQEFTVADPSNARNGNTVTLDIIQTRVREITQSNVSLDSINGVKFNTYLQSNSSVTNLDTSGEYAVSYDSTNKVFTATHRDFAPLASSINFSVAEMLAAEDSNYIWGLCGWAPGFGEICLQRDALASPAESLAVKRVSTFLTPENYPTTLYCLRDCPTYTKIEAAKTKIGNDESPDSVYGGVSNGWGGSLSDFTTYTLNTSTSNYGAGDGDASMGTVSSGLYTKLDSSDLSYGVYSQELVTSPSTLACSGEFDYCMEPIWNGTVTTYYAFESGHKPWNQTRRLLDSSNNVIPFSKPTILYFTAPDDTSKYGEFAGKEVQLEFNGGSDLWGIPGRCLNKTTGAFVNNCFINGSNDGDGVWPWVDLFKLPKNLTTGRLYTGSGQTGTYYLAAPNEGVVFLGLNAAAVGTLTLGDVTELPSTAPTNIGPNGGANYIGAEPTQPTTPSVRAGVKVTSD